MNKKFLFLLIFIIFGCSLLMPDVQRVVVKNYINAFTNFKVRKIDGLKISFFKHNANLDELILAEKDRDDDAIRVTKANIQYKNSKFIIDCNEVKYKSAESEKTGFSDFSGITPEFLATALHKGVVFLKNFESVNIQKITIDKEVFSLEVKSQEEDTFADIFYGDDRVAIKINGKKISADGMWKTCPIFLECEIEPNAIGFAGNSGLLGDLHPALVESLGAQIFVRGILRNDKEWCLENFELETSGNHKIKGKCLQKRGQLDGKFVWHVPNKKNNSEVTLLIGISGFAQQPQLLLELEKPDKTIQKLSGALDIINAKKIKLILDAYHDNANHLGCDFYIALDPLNISGKLNIDIKELEKLFANFLPSLKGCAKINADFKDFKGVHSGMGNVNGEASVSVKDIHLPIKINMDVKDGKGKCDIEVNKGKYLDRMLALKASVVACDKAITVNQFNVKLDTAHFSLVSPCIYGLHDGLEKPAKFRLLDGDLVVNNYVYANSFKRSNFNLSAKNIQLKKISYLANPFLLSGTLDFKLEKNKGEACKLSLDAKRLNLSKIKHFQSYSVIRNLHINTVLEFDDEYLSWKINANDADRMKVVSAGTKNKDNQVDGTAKGAVNLMLLTDLMATTDKINGDVTFDLKFSGDAQKPEFRGYMNADNGLYELSDVGIYYQNIKIRTKVNGHKLTVNHFTAQDFRNSRKPESGQLRGDGWIDISDITYPHFNVALYLKSLRIAQQENFVSDATGVLKIIGKGSDVGCEGEVTLENATYYLGEDLDNKVVVLKEKTVEKKRAKDKPHNATVFPLDILVHVPRHELTVLGMGANISWEGDFYIKKSIMIPAMDGSILLSDGTLEVLGKSLKITRGSIIFVENDRNNPRLDIVASKDMGDGIVASIEIKGKADDTIIDFNSTPPLQKEEVLSLLLFGKRLGDVSVLQSVQLAAIVNMSGKDKKKDTNILSELKNSFDEFEFKTVTRGGTRVDDKDATPQERANAKTAQALRIGKDFGKVRVSVEQGAGAETSMLVVSTPITNNLVLQGDVGGAQNTGVGVSWVKRY